MTARAYRFLDGEPVADGVRRIARGRIDSALDELRGRTASSPEGAVHEARKDMKKLRALLRLLRAELGDELYRRENAAVRDAAQRLSGVRDADVMLATLGALEAAPPDAAGGLTQALEAHRRSLEADGAGREEGSRQAVAALRGVRERVEEWPLERDGFAVLEPGLRRGYRRGRRALALARPEPTGEHMHEWRKRAKDLWYHLTLLRDAWPAALEPLGDEVHALSDRLGDDHDLVVLLQFAHRHATALGDMPELVRFERAVEERRRELQADAFAYGARVYAERPRAFARRIGSYWEAWRPAVIRVP